jgi:hypothetical protein
VTAPPPTVLPSIRVLLYRAHSQHHLVHVAHLFTNNRLLLTHFGHHRWCHSQSVLGKDTVRSFAEALGHAEVEDDVCTLLASDLEYRLREITQVHSYTCTFVALSLTSTHLVPWQPLRCALHQRGCRWHGRVSHERSRDLAMEKHTPAESETMLLSHGHVQAACFMQ